MKKHLLGVILFVLTSTYTQAAEYPVLLACKQNLTDSLQIEACSKEAFNTFLKQGKMRLVKQLGLFFNEEVHIRFKVKDDGSISIKDADSYYTKMVGDKMKDWLTHLDGKLVPREGREEIEFKLEFSLPSQEEKDVMLVDEMPTLSICSEFNAAGKRSCLLQTIANLATPLYLRRYDGYSEMDLIFSGSGSFMGVRFDSPTLTSRRKLNDSLMMRFAQLGRVLIEKPGAYSPANFKYRFTYHHFDSEIDDRLYFEEMAGEFLKRGDTTHYIHKMIQSALEYRKFSTFQTYITQICNRNNIDLKKRFPAWGDENASLDSILKLQAYFDERTISSLGINYEHASPNECLDSDSLHYCMQEHVNSYVHQSMDSLYGLDLSQSLYSSTRSEYMFHSSRFQHVGTVGTDEGFFVFEVYINDDGKIHAVIPLARSHHPTIKRYEIAKASGASQEELNSILDENITYRFINVLSKLPKLVPASVNGIDYKSSKTLVITTGKRT